MCEECEGTFQEEDGNVKETWMGSRFADLDLAQESQKLWLDADQINQVFFLGD